MDKNYLKSLLWTALAGAIISRIYDLGVKAGQSKAYTEVNEVLESWKPKEE